MSRSPRARESRDSFSEYRLAWQAAATLIRSGHSFSGRERNCVFLNCRNDSFANISAVSGLDFKDDGRAIAVTDWDLDGDLDVWLHNRTGPRLRFMRNQTIQGERTAHANFVAIGLEGTSSNRDAIGARVELFVEDPQPPKLVQTLAAGDGFLSQSSKWLHFGLGPDRRTMTALVRWPGGDTENSRQLRREIDIGWSREQGTSRY